MRVASCLASLTALESLAIRDFFLQGEERQEAPASVGEYVSVPGARRLGRAPPCRPRL